MVVVAPPKKEFWVARLEGWLLVQLHGHCGMCLWTEVVEGQVLYSAVLVVVEHFVGL
jgi:hypothetical protein